MTGTEIYFLLGLLFVFLFRYKNTDKEFLNVVSLSLIGLFTVDVVSVHLGDSFGKLFWIASSTTLIISYVIRFKRRRKKQVIDYIKLPAMVLLIMYPLAFYDFVFERGYDWSLPRLVILVFTASVYLCDRLTHRFGILKNPLSILLMLQTVTIVILVGYVFVRRAEASKMKKRAIQEFIKAAEQKSQAEENAKVLQRAKEEPDENRE